MLSEDSRSFLDWIADWQKSLPRIALKEAILEPERTAILAVDLLRGFCYEGPLSSKRVAGIVDPIVSLFKNVYRLGVRHFVLPQENHPPDAVEFESYGPHCIAGTAEAETVSELTALPFSDLFVIVNKNSVNPFIETELGKWVDERPELNTFIVVGDCTDICVYQLAMHLRLLANARQLQNIRVMLPADCVDTYHLPVSTAKQIGAVPHDGDLLHSIFLYHMMLNGIEVVAGLDG